MNVDELFAQTGDRREVAEAAIGSVLVQMSLAPLEQRKRELIAAAATITVVGLLIAAWLARSLSADVVRPVLQLAAIVGRVKGGDLGARARIDAGGAVRLLASGINEMAAALEAGQQDLALRVQSATAALQRQKELAEQANRTKTQFLAAASHDLRQPIQAAGLFVSALRLRAKDEDTLRMVSRIERALAGLDAVLDALLDISRLDACAVVPRPESLPLDRLFSSLRDTFAASAAEAGLTFRIAKTTTWCCSDPLLLERILSNLVSNALRYTASGGVLIGCRRHGAGLRIEVWDTGAGIPEGKSREIFREFVQLKNPTRGRDKGLGLGLAIVERLSRLLQHPVTLRSRVGKGSVFAVEVPRAAPPKPAQTPLGQARAPSDFQGKRVLVIDDDPDVLDSLRMFLSQVGADVTTAGTSAEAHAAADRGPPFDVVLSDYRLPDGDGVTLFEHLRHAGRALTGVIITGETDSEVLQRVVASGLPCLHKPVAAEVLHAAIAGRLDR
jgi:signal transduction histidine kinase